MLGAYALDAVEPEEAAQLEDHLATCPRCRAEIDEHRFVAGAMGNTVEELPPHLWDRIAGQLGRGPVPVGVPDLGVPVDPGPAPGEDEAAIVSIRTGRRRRPRRWVAAGAAVAAVAAIAVLGVNLAHANNQIAQLSGSGEQAAVARALQQDHQLVDLRTPGGEPKAVIVLLPNGRGYFTQSTLPSVGSSFTYQLWAMSGGKFISVGLLGPDPGEAGFTVNPKTISAVAITVEPAGGVTAPDRTPVVQGALS